MLWGIEVGSIVMLLFGVLGVCGFVRYLLYVWDTMKLYVWLRERGLSLGEVLVVPIIGDYKYIKEVCGSKRGEEALKLVVMSLGGIVLGFLWWGIWGHLAIRAKVEATMYCVRGIGENIRQYERCEPKRQRMVLYPMEVEGYVSKAHWLGVSWLVKVLEEDGYVIDYEGGSREDKSKNKRDVRL